MGILGVVCGVFLIAGGPGLWQAAHDPQRQARVRTGIFYGGFTGLFIASYTVVDGYAVKVALMSPILVDYFGNLVRLVFLLPTLLRDRPAVWALWLQQRRYALVVGIFSPCRMCWCFMRCRWRRCRMWRLHVRCPCCLPPCWVATCWAKKTGGRASPEPC